MGKGGGKICQEEGMKGKPSLGLRNYKNLIVTTIYLSFNMGKAVYYPISSSLSTLWNKCRYYSYLLDEEMKHREGQLLAQQP